MCPVDKLIDGLNELFMQFFDLHVLLGPIVRIRGDVYTMDVFMILYQRFYRVGCELECDLVP
jgi:hypothetical protein